MLGPIEMSGPNCSQRNNSAPTEPQLEPIATARLRDATNTNRIVIAPVGSTIINEEGEEQELKRTAVSGIMSEGMFCDARMLGWGDGSNGVAAQVPESYKPGMSPPKEKPMQKKKEEENRLPAVEVEPLFEKKLTKVS